MRQLLLESRDEFLQRFELPEKFELVGVGFPRGIEFRGIHSAETSVENRAKAGIHIPISNVRPSACLDSVLLIVDLRPLYLWAVEAKC